MKPTILVTGIALASAAAALAHSGATGVVKQRMDNMDVLKAQMKALRPMMQGKAAYDPASVRQAARTIAAHAGETLTTLFPEGSLDHPSEALPAIWDDWARFSGLAAQLAFFAEGLAAAADNAPGGADGMGDMMASGGLMAAGGMMGGAMRPDPETLADMPADRVFARVAQTCSACHADFRKD